jgi:hypothetical protein
MKPVHGIVVACLALLLFTAGLASSASAFGLSSAGVRLGATDPEGGNASLSGGGHLEFEESHSRFHLTPSVLFWSNDGLSDVNPNFDVYYHFEPAGHVTPYLGAGAALHIYSADGPADPGTDMGLNLFGGVQFPMGGASRLFGEARYSASDISQTSFFGGITFPISH